MILTAVMIADHRGRRPDIGQTCVRDNVGGNVVAEIVPVDGVVVGRVLQPKAVVTAVAEVVAGD